MCALVTSEVLGKLVLHVAVWVLPCLAKLDEAAVDARQAHCGGADSSDAPTTVRRRRSYFECWRRRHLDPS
jgi:hypothetical protein